MRNLLRCDKQYPLIKVPYLLIIWGAASKKPTPLKRIQADQQKIVAVFGPALAPVIANFSAPAENWHWVSWEMLWLSAPILVCFFFLLPETSSSTILYRRAKRLRELTGNHRFLSQVEIDQAKMKLSFKGIVYNAIIKPAQINALDPAVLFSTIYTSLVYGIFYSFFESFPLVFQDIYHFEFPVSGLPFLGVFPGCLAAASLCIGYWHFSVVRPFRTKGFEAFGMPENRLVPALYACFWLPIGLFLFGTYTYSSFSHTLVHFKRTDTRHSMDRSPKRALDRRYRGSVPEHYWNLYHYRVHAAVSGLHVSEICGVSIRSE